MEGSSDKAFRINCHVPVEWQMWCRWFLALTFDFCFLRAKSNLATEHKAMPVARRCPLSQIKSHPNGLVKGVSDL